jgi:glycosyltransferase involved in cell wall biosynthesis
VTDRRWHLITGEYPPQTGGVSDYTAVVAAALADAGCEVHVWAPPANGPDAAHARVHVHRMAEGFTEAGLHALTAEFQRDPEPRTILVQYVPQAFGAHGMNLRFCRWVQQRARERRDDVRVMFHEPYYPFTLWPPQRILLALANRLMAVLLLSDTRVAYVSTGAWERRLRRYAPRACRFAWLPVPSSIPALRDDARVAEWRSWLAPTAETAVVGHFGTYGALVARTLAPALSRILLRDPRVRVCLIGPGSEAFADRLCTDRTDWRPRITATERLSGEEVAACLQACDVALQPYADGASGRRTTLMAALINGVPVVSNRGPATEAEWERSRGIAFAPRARADALADSVLRLLENRAERERTGAAGAALYAARFAVAHTVDTLLTAPSQLRAP